MTLKSSQRTEKHGRDSTADEPPTEFGVTRAERTDRTWSPIIESPSSSSQMTAWWHGTVGLVSRLLSIVSRGGAAFVGRYCCGLRRGVERAKVGRRQRENIQYGPVAGPLSRMVLRIAVAVRLLLAARRTLGPRARARGLYGVEIRPIASDGSQLPLRD